MKYFFKVFFCYLTRLDPGIFSHLSSLEELNLFQNELVELDMDLFKNLAVLKKLNLSSNKIDK